MRHRSSRGMEHVPRRSPISRDEFHRSLRAWHADAYEGDFVRDEAALDEDAHDEDDWVWIKHMGNRYYLDANSSWEGAGRYLALLDAEGDGLRWHAPASGGEVAVGAGGEHVPGFLLVRAT